jgi:hypothetical protein|tara:strand:+ start:89 stop:289 length:201 start_codon:yes stop_codon:yes gene_type:complete
MRIDYESELGVRLLKEMELEGFVYHLVNREPDLAQKLSDMIAWQIQDNDYLLKGVMPSTTGEQDAS